jgi:hypothetical protein
MMMSVTMLLATFENQALDLTLCIVGQFTPVSDKVLLNHTIRVPLTGFDLGAQQSCEEWGFYGRGRKPGPSG